MPQLPAGRGGGKAAPEALREPGPVRLPPFPAGGSASTRGAGRGGGGVCGGTGPVLGDARPAVREPEPPEARAPAPLRGTIAARHGAVRCRTDRSRLPAARARAPAERTRQRRALHARLLRQWPDPGLLVRPGIPVQGGRGGATPAGLMSSPLEGRWAQAFPTLTPAQMARLEAHGTRMQTRRGEILAERGERFSKMLVVLSGSLEVVRPGLTGEEPITIHEPGGFTGEIS